MNEKTQNFDRNEYLKGKTITKQVYIEGIGTAILYGELDMDKMIDWLLKVPEIIKYP